MPEEKEVTAVLEEIKTAFKDAEKEMVALIEKQKKEIDEQGETTKKTADKIKKTEETLQNISDDLKAVQDKQKDMETKMGRLPAGGSPAEKKSLGEMFIESDSYKNFNGNGKSDRLEVKSLWKHHHKTITGDALDNIPGYLYSPERIAEIIAGPERVDRVRDLIPVENTGSGAIEYVVESGFTNSAAPVPEFEDEDDPHAEITEKPKSKIEFDIKSISVKTIAHWLPATRQIIEDAAQLRAHIDRRLMYGLKLEEDDQILYGSGTGEDLQGIMTHTGVQTYNWSSGPVGDTKIDAVRRAMTRATVAEYPVTGLVLHPYDWEDIELMKGSDGHYIWVIVTQGGEKRLWRVNVVETTAIREEQFLTGAFELATTLWDRQQAGIRVSDSHDKFFTKNLWAILAEERLAQTIHRPEGFVIGQFDSAPVSS